MLPIVKKDVMSILGETIISLKNGQHHKLGELSNHVIHDASIYQDNDSITVAVMIYALSKVIQRCCEKKVDYSGIIKTLEDSFDSLRRNNFTEYNKYIQEIMKYVEQTDDKMKVYIQEVFDKAKIKKASKLHEHGLSIGRTAEILGISQWDLLNYIGNTAIEPVTESTGIKARLAFARGLFVQ